MKARHSQIYGLLAGMGLISGMVTLHPDLLLPLPLLAGMAFSIWWLYHDSRHLWGTIDLTIKSAVVSAAILILGRPIFYMVAVQARDDSLDRFVAAPLFTSLVLAWTIFVFRLLQLGLRFIARMRTKPSRIAEALHD